MGIYLDGLYSLCLVLLHSFTLSHDCLLNALISSVVLPKRDNTQASLDEAMLNHTMLPVSS